MAIDVLVSMNSLVSLLHEAYLHTISVYNIYQYKCRVRVQLLPVPTILYSHAFGFHLNLISISGHFRKSQVYNTRTVDDRTYY